MLREPSERYASAGFFANALARWLASTPGQPGVDTHAWPVGVVVLSAFVVGLAVGLGKGVATCAVGVVAGYYHTCAMLAGGDAKCWGYGAWGKLGTGSVANVGDATRPSASALAALRSLFEWLASSINRSPNRVRSNCIDLL